MVGIASPRTNPIALTEPRGFGMGSKTTGRVNMRNECMKAPVAKVAAGGAETGKLATVKREGDNLPLEFEYLADKEASADELETDKEAGFNSDAFYAALRHGVDQGGKIVAGATMIGAGLSAANMITDAAHQGMTRLISGDPLEKALELNPKLRSYPMEELKDYYNIIHRASPTVAESPRLLANYMQYMLDHEGSINFMAFDQLAKLEGQVLSNNAERGVFSPAVHKSMYENAIGGMLNRPTTGAAPDIYS